MRTFALAFFLFNGCASLYPIGGAIVGGGAGSLAGPAGAAIGAGAGAATGQILAKDEDLKEAKDTIKAISKGDVEALVAAGIGQQKGFVDSAIDTLMGTIKLICIGLLLFNLVPIIYTRFVHKKANGNSKKA